jgi:hypothetical protein
MKKYGLLSFVRPNLLLNQGVPALIAALFLLLSPTAYADNWEPIANTAALKAIYSDTELLGVDWRAEFCADGSTVQVAWGETLVRAWKVKGDNQVCISAGVSTKCFVNERNTSKPGEYRCRVVGTQTYRWFKLTDRRPKSCINKTRADLVKKADILDTREKQ